MADNVAITAGSGTTVAADDVGGVMHQRVKVVWGPDGTANDSDTATGKPLPVQVRSATGLIPLGEPTDAKATQTDTTSVSIVSILKQISASVQAPTPTLNPGTALIGRAAADASSATGGITTTARMESSAASTNATNVKTSQGRIYSIQGRNTAAYDVFLVLYNSASNPPVPGTTTIRKKMCIPAGTAFVFDYALGLFFGSGIGYAFTKLAADADTTAIAAGDIVQFNMDYV